MLLALTTNIAFAKFSAIEETVSLNVMSSLVDQLDSLEPKAEPLCEHNEQEVDQYPQPKSCIGLSTGYKVKIPSSSWLDDDIQFSVEIPKNSLNVVYVDRSGTRNEINFDALRVADGFGAPDLCYSKPEDCQHSLNYHTYELSTYEKRYRKAKHSAADEKKFMSMLNCMNDRISLVAKKVRIEVQQKNKITINNKK